MLLFQRSLSSISEFFHLLLIFLVLYFIYHEGFVIMDSVAMVSWEIMPGGLVLSTLRKSAVFASGRSNSGVLGLCSSPLLTDIRLSLRLAVWVAGSRH